MEIKFGKGRVDTLIIRYGDEPQQLAQVGDVAYF